MGIGRAADRDLVARAQVKVRVQGAVKVADSDPRSRRVTAVVAAAESARGKQRDPQFPSR
jgi:hypothetical protein